MKTENKNKLILFIASLVTLISIFSSLNIQLASANWDSGNGSDYSGALIGGSEATWLKVTGNVNGNSLFYRAYRRRDDKRTLSSLFNEAKNNKIESFIKAQDRYIFYINDRVLPGVLPRATWDNSPLPKLPDKTDAESRAIFNEVKRNNPRFQYKPFVVFGNFSKPKSSCATGVCVCDVGTGPKYKSNKKFEQDKLNVSGDYSYQITITPVKPIGFENLSKEEQVEWLSTHRTQMTNPELTAFGKFVKEYNYSNFSGQVNSQKLWDDFKKQAEEKSKESINSPNINLSEDNLKGFQRGGAFTITTNVKKVTISTSVTTDYREVYDCVKENDGKYYYKKTGEERVGTLVSEANSGGVSKSINFDTIGGYTPKYSYQIINVRCNRNYFSDLVRNTKSKITSGSKTLSSSAQSPLVENGIATFYNNLDTKFFYKGTDCIFKCSASPTGQSAGPNDANKNVQNRGNNKIKYGAQSKENNSNDSFSFFRDNIFEVVRFDVWHPIVNNQEMSYNPDTQAYKTKLLLDKAGTPKGELFSITDKDGNVLLKDFPSNSTLTLDGQINRFGYQGAYASEKGKEHKTNLNFTYSVNTKISVPTLNVNGVVSTTDYDTEALDVTCETWFNTTELGTAFVSHGPKANNYKDNSIFINGYNKSLKVSFVKASAE